jgi:hypothetical protein
MRSRPTPTGGAATPAEAVDGSLERHEAFFFRVRPPRRDVASTMIAILAVLFWEKPSRFIRRLTVESLRSVPVMCSKKRRLCEMVAVGRSSTSCSSRTVAFSSTLWGRPGLFLGVSDSPLYGRSWHNA